MRPHWKSLTVSSNIEFLSEKVMHTGKRISNIVSIGDPMLFPRLFKQAVARTPDRTAVVNIETGREATYAELAEKTYSIATGLRENGVEKGDRVGICMGNRMEHITLFLATQMIGAVFTSFNFRETTEGVKYHVSDSGADILFFDELSQEAVEGAEDDLDVESVYVGNNPPAFAEKIGKYQHPSPNEPEIVVDSDDLSVLQYTSGTTGNPKGVPLDHRATTARIIVNAMGQRYYLGETMIGAMPIYHGIGLHGILCNVLSLSGTYLTMLDYDPEQAVRAISEYSVTALHEAPTIYRNLLDTDAIEDVSVDSVSKISYSGAPMSTSLFDEVLDVFEPDHISNAYGSTEVYGSLAYMNLKDIGDPAVCGPAGIFIQTRIVEPDSDDPTAEVPSGEEGELIINTDSPVAFDEYWNKPQETAEAIHNGWLFTGDAARETENGNTIITGRTDDMIISGGENIHPSNVEDILASHPNVVDVGVVGTPDEQWGETVTAFVVVTDDVTEEDLDHWCLNSDELPDFKRPRNYIFVDELPRNPSGKVLRYKLRENYD